MAKPRTTGKNVFKPIPNNKCKYFAEILLTDTVDSSSTSLVIKNRHCFWAESIDSVKSKLKLLYSKGIKRILIWNSAIYQGDIISSSTIYGVKKLAGVDQIIGNFYFNYNRNRLEPLAMNGLLVSKLLNRTKDMKLLFSFLKELGKNGR